MSSHCTVASAPGKVLLAGGYLVLEQAYSGVVVGTSARFYTVIRSEKSLEPAGTITVQSPQFNAATWKYNAIADKEKVNFQSITTESRNKFVETCLCFTLNIIAAKTGLEQFNSFLNNGIEVTIVGDNDFYSQRAQLESKGLPNTASALASLKPFCKTGTTLSAVHKTGLGSSAALTVSLVAALLLHFKVITPTLNTTEKTLAHNVAQFVHCFAQGKVGSGFDVSSAIWGSHRYKRFNPSILSPLMDENVDPKVLSKALDADNQSWDNEVDPFKLPPGFDLMLADIDAGSHTPTLVGKVLAWKKLNPDEANALWTELGSYNSKVEQHFRRLNELYVKDTHIYNDTIDKCTNLNSTDWNAVPGPVAEELVALVNDFSVVRRLLQKMSELADVPIEPKEQTKLLDACTNIPGVVMAGVPGAGGYDAIFCIVLSNKSKKQIFELWESWKELTVGPLLSRSDSDGLTTVDIDTVPCLSTIL
ncbi:Phosphomevalonate kinase [Mycotypha africana]|uniref:Phosphomevalonate kinase n=1 Tax=Mycotypha africana TaxID=64632 RepID=UPI002300F33D|nr:Phosphomevalonate kinase [Mycotypha africana]KAI8992041.1 Phosphomevalonate kinase [Mycotypha africana]